jgi:hypothetical protein
MKPTWCPAHQGLSTFSRVQKKGVMVWKILT